jgi:hypothetical protein
MQIAHAHTPPPVSAHTIAGSVPRCPGCGGQSYDSATRTTPDGHAEVTAMTCAACGHDILAAYEAQPRSNYNFTLALPRFDIDFAPFLWGAAALAGVALILIMQPTYGPPL